MKPWNASLTPLSWQKVHMYIVTAIVLTGLLCIMIAEVVGIMRVKDYGFVGLSKLIGVSVFYLCVIVLARACRRRTNEHADAENIQSVGMAEMVLNANKNAIAIVDQERSVLMLNSAFWGVLGHSNGTDLRSLQLEDILNLSQEDTSLLLWYLQQSTPTEVDFSVNGGIIRVSVSMTGVEAKSYTVLQDITDAYALQQAVSRAKEQTRNLIQAMGAQQGHARQLHHMTPNDFYET